MRPVHATSHIIRGVPYSEPINPVGNTDTLAARFHAKYHRRGDHECWFWTGRIQPNGYGMISGGKRGSHPLYAHRVAYQLAHGPIPEGCEIGHTCHQRNCVNFGHLVAVTHTENVRHSARDGRLHVSRPSGHKVTDADCNAIVARVAAGERQTDLASEFRVSKSFVSQLIKGQRRQYRKAS